MKRRSREEWKHLLDQQASSGQSTKQFCQEHGINEHYFSCVKSKLKQAGRRQSRFQSIGTLAPIQMITLRQGDIVINLPPTIDPAWLAALAKQLAA